MDSLKLELLKNKQEHAQSAIASQEVREHLAGFIRSKRQGGGQINNIHSQASHQHLSKCGYGAQTSGSASYASHYVANLINEGPLDDDHPLRKTASMPTMHIPYKAQSLSRRHQMERRTTMSPLMRRKSKPKRQLLHSQDSSSTEYSSNPCIIQSSQASARSLSQSSSPPPIPMATGSSHQQPVKMETTSEPGTSSTGQLQQRSSSPAMAGNNPLQPSCSIASPASSTTATTATTTAISSACQNQPDPTAAAAAANTSQAIKLSSIFTNSELENLQNNLKNSLYFSPGSHSSSTNLHQAGAGLAGSATGQQAVEATDAGQGNLLLDQNALRQQQHLKVNEAIRKTVIQRASSRGRNMAGAGGSLDIEGTLAAGGMGADTGCGSGGGKSSHGQASFGEELRQWSLDGADLRTSATLNKLASTPTAGLWDFHKLRLDKTKDAAALRRSQSPSSSISMGLSSSQAAASVAAGQLQQQHQRPGSIAAANSYARATSGQQATNQMGAKHHSSSSSSTSSLLSQQDSLEDSSSQAIDLSSSSEAGRRHHHQSSLMFAANSSSNNNSNRSRQQLTASQLIKNTNNTNAATNPNSKPAANQQYQKVLQESFNQLQLCHSHGEGMNQFLMQTTTKHHQQQPPPSQHQAVQRGDSSNATCHHQHPPSLLGASKMTSSLDASNGQQHQQHQQQQPMASLSEQFNLSASAQNLISLQQDHYHHVKQFQHQHDPQAPTALAQMGPLMAHSQQHDLNQLMMAYKNLIQSPDGQQQQQQTPGQISGTLLSKMANLPDAYKSSLISHLMQQQQQHQQQQQFGTFNTLSADAGAGCDQSKTISHNAHHYHRHHHQYHHYLQEQGLDNLDQRSLISRALSSPLLASRPSNSSLDTPMQESNQQQQQHDSMMCCDMIPIDGGSNNNNRGPIQAELFNCDLAPAEMNVDSRHRDPLNGASAAAASVMMIDNIDDNLEKTKSKQFSIVENSGHSLDLTTSNRATCATSAPAGGGQASGCGSCGSNKRETTALSFNYTPRDPLKVSCSFIYNPVFDKSSSTGLIYELGMCNHKCICGDENNHPENSHRILAIWKRLYDTGLMAKCARIEGRRATLEEIQLCHSETYSYYFGKGPYERLKISQLDLSKLPIEGLTQLECGGQGADIDTPWNEEQTPGVARLAAGCVIEAAVKVANGKLMNAFAIVRPPGHHAEFQQAMGFCFFNSVAIAARVLISKHQLARVLIVDWDVHHGNGIQKMFYEDKRVMYISLHRHDRGNFFPGTGDTKEIGAGPGEGFNWNIAWSSESMGDAEYLAAFRCVVMPIAVDYNPSMVLVACGFDAARGHPFNFGGYDLSPACFAYMTRQLMSLANGRLVLCLEGGYQLNSICDCAEACVRALLNESPNSCQSSDQVRESELRREPNQSASEVLSEVSTLAAKYWPNVERWRTTIDRSALEAAANVR